MDLPVRSFRVLFAMSGMFGCCGSTAVLASRSRRLLRFHVAPRPQVNDFFAARDLCMVAHSLARHRHPGRPTLEEASAGAASAEPFTTWPFEERCWTMGVDSLEAAGAERLVLSVRVQSACVTAS